jgi:uncharacterized protein
MKIPGKIKNVVDFGAFVDLGIKESALVHISELSDHFVRDPLEVVKVGDVLEFTIISLDTDRRRIGLSRKTNPGQGGEAHSGSGVVPGEASYPAEGAAASSGPARSGTIAGGAASAPVAGLARPGKKRMVAVQRAEKTGAAISARPEHPARPESRPGAGGAATKSGRPERPPAGTDRPGGSGGFNPRNPGNDDGTMYNPFAEALRKMREGKSGKK